jgi:hypothetical protein
MACARKRVSASVPRLDVLNAQQELVNARVALVSAQRDRVVASYTVAFVGRAAVAASAGLRVPTYDAAVHYHQVRDSWAGVRTPTDARATQDAVWPHGWALSFPQLIALRVVPSAKSASL